MNELTNEEQIDMFLIMLGAIAFASVFVYGYAVNRTNKNNLKKFESKSSKLLSATDRTLARFPADSAVRKLTEDIIVANSYMQSLSSYKNDVFLKEAEFFLSNSIDRALNLYDDEKSETYFQSIRKELRESMLVLMKEGPETDIDWTFFRK